MENKPNAILEQLTLRQEVDPSFQFFDRIEGLLYPGYVTTNRKESTKAETTSVTLAGYESSFINPLKNIGYFVQSSGRLKLEKFKATKTLNSGFIDIGFEFMQRDKSVYTLNECIIYYAYASYGYDMTVQMRTPGLKLVGGIKGQTRIFLNKYGLDYHHECMDEFLNTLIKNMMETPDGEAIPLILELYIK